MLHHLSVAWCLAHVCMQLLSTTTSSCLAVASGRCSTELQTMVLSAVRSLAARLGRAPGGGHSDPEPVGDHEGGGRARAVSSGETVPCDQPAPSTGEGGGEFGCRCQTSPKALREWLHSLFDGKAACLNIRAAFLNGWERVGPPPLKSSDRLSYDQGETYP
jgi:hypothetical protein